MTLEEKINAIPQILKKILDDKESFEPEKDLLDQYTALLVSITKENPTKESANIGMKLMHMIFVASLDTSFPKWLYEIEEMTYAYFYF